MATAGQKQKLQSLDTKGVAVVTAGANGKRWALAKSKLGADPTFDEILAEVIKAGEMPLDEKAIEDMCMSAGLDAQATETFKAMMKLAHVYRDNAAFNGLLKQSFAKPGAEAPAPQGQPQPGMPGQPGQVQPGQPQPGAQAQPAAQQGQPGAPGQPAPGQPPEKGKPPFGGEGDEKKPPFGEGAEAEETEEETTPAGDEGEGKMPMDAEEEKKLKKAAEEAVAKAAAAEAQIAELKKSNGDLKVALDTQAEVIKSATDAVKTMRDDMKKAEWVSKARTDLAFLPGKTADELGEMLFKLDALDAAQAKTTFELLKSQSDTMRASGLFQRSGVTGGAPAGAHGSAWDEIEKLAGEIVAKSDKREAAEVAKARAVDAVFKARPDLYKRYCDEQERAAKQGRAS